MELEVPASYQVLENQLPLASRARLAETTHVIYTGDGATGSKNKALEELYFLEG